MERTGFVRAAGDGIARVLAAPAIGLHRVGLLSFTGVSQGFALVPGRIGRALRRAWYSATLVACGRNFTVDFGAALRTPRSRVGSDCYIGVYNWLGWVDLGDDFMSGSHVTILSGRGQHGVSRVDVSMRAQEGQLECVRIGDDVWVGAGAVIGADVAAHTIVASGAVVTRPDEPYGVLGGVPARRIFDRRAGAPHHA